MRTYTAKKEEVERNWYLIDATDEVLGRLAVYCAKILMGKTKPEYTPHIDTGDFVVVMNAEKVRVTGRKAIQKTYKRYSGYPGGLKEIPYKRMLERHPERIITHAVKGMLPKNRLGRKMLKKLKVYAGSSHPHEAQNPKTIKVGEPFKSPENRVNEEISE